MQDLVRLGLVHIPGSSGTSLGTAIAQSLGCRYLPTHRVRESNSLESEDLFTLEVPTGRDSLTREILLSYPLIAGHLSVGEIQATNRTHLILTVSEPRRRLINLFAHHAGSEISFSDWLNSRIGHRSETIDQLSGHNSIPDGISWQEMHARGHRVPSNKTWLYDDDFVSMLLAPIDYIFLSNEPQFVIDTLVMDKVLPRSVKCGILNLRSPQRRLNWGNTSEALSTLKQVTQNSYRFIDQVTNTAKVSPAFKKLSDDAIAELLVEVIGATS